MDSADRAQAEIERQLDCSIAAARGMLPSGESVSDCVHCGIQISSGRQVALPGVDSCSECARRIAAGLPV